MAKPKKTQPAATAPRVDVFDAKGKPKTVDASALRIAFADGRSLLVSLPDTADGAITLVAEHADAATHAMLALRPSTTTASRCASRPSRPPKRKTPTTRWPAPRCSRWT